jgi:branched-chain amino acid transport system ATP-binding protein
MSTAAVLSSEGAAVSDVILEAAGLVKTFGGFNAVDGVDLKVREGTIHALIGPNGAGKTTCFNLLSKFLQPTAGSIRLSGQDITRLQPAQVARMGMVRSFQISATFLSMTALENVRLALQRQRGENYDFWMGRKALRQFEAQAQGLLADVGLTELADTPASLLSYGHKRALELATTLALQPRVMLLDEPTAGMTHADVDRIVSLIQRIRGGRTIVVVEHNLSVVEGLCDAVTVLTRGKVLTEGTYDAVSRDPAVITAYLGSDDGE